MSLRRMGSRAIVLSGLTTLILMAFGAGVSYAKTETTLATYYEDSLDNLCVGLPAVGGFAEGCDWKGMAGRDNVGVGADVLKNDAGGGQNVAIGTDALFFNTEGSFNVASGFAALGANTEGRSNVATGADALASNTEGSHNVASGSEALRFNTSGSNNVASGAVALLSNKTGSNNLASGGEALSNNTGSANVALGTKAGGNLTSGSNNIDIANEGVAAEAGTTRIGTEGKQTKAFVAGIFPTEVLGCFVQVTKEGQLGCNSKAAVEGKEGKEGKPGPPGPEGKEGKEGKTGPTGPAGDAAIATFASFEEVDSGDCLNYTEVGGPGTASCPAKASGFSAGRLLAGPTPANGARVTNLYADSSASLSGSDTVLVAVIDNSTGATLLSCTVTKASKGSCSNSSGSGAVAAGENIEVKLTTSGPSGTDKQWRVRFRY